MALDCEMLHVFTSLRKQIGDNEISSTQGFLLPPYKSMLAFPLRGQCQSGEISFGPFNTQFFSEQQGSCCQLVGLRWGEERAAYKVLPAGSSGTVMHNFL